MIDVFDRPIIVGSPGKVAAVTRYRSRPELGWAGFLAILRPGV